MFTNVLYDETPVITRHREKHKPADTTSKTGASATTKLLAIVFDLGILVRDLDSGNLNLTMMSLPWPVQALQAGTEAILKHGLQMATRVLLLEEIRDVISPAQHAVSDEGVVHPQRPFSVDTSCCDRAGSNRVAEDGLYGDVAGHVKRLRFPCFAHIGSTSTGRGLSSCSQDMTGMIASSLCMDAAGSVNSFRECCIDTLVESMLPTLDAPRQRTDHETVIYFRDLLHLCIPCSDQGSARANRLMGMLTSGFQELLIQLRIPGEGIYNCADVGDQRCV